jgi:hypothetical protein
MIIPFDKPEHAINYLIRRGAWFDVDNNCWCFRKQPTLREQRAVETFRKAGLDVSAVPTSARKRANHSIPRSHDRGRGSIRC